MSRDLIINIANQTREGLVASPLSEAGSSMAPIVKGDSELLRIFPVTPTGDQSRPWESVDLTGYSIAASVGNPGQKPTGGEFDIEYDGDTASDLAYDINPHSLNSHLNQLASITSDGGVTVTGVAGDYYVVEWDSVGARSTDFTTDSTELSPFGSVVVDTIQVGDSTTKEIRLISLRSQLYATKGSFTAVADITGIVTVIAAGSGSSHAIQSFKFSRSPVGGTFTLTFDGATTVSLPHDATASQVQTALGSGYLVEGSAGGPWTVEKDSNGAVSAGSMDVAGIAGLDGWQATINFATKELFLELAASSEQEISRTFEVEFTDASGNVETVLQIPVTISKEVMASGITSTLAAEFGVPPSALGVNSYASLSAANAGEALHNVLFYNTTINKYQMTTSDS